MAAFRYRFSERFGVVREEDDDWFDTLLPADTQLFVDPFLIYKDRSRAWAGAHDELISFFNLVLTLMADAGLDPGSQRFRAAAGLLMFPEPVEFCLGYAESSEGGRGTARRRRNEMLRAGAIAIDAGLDSLEHFEEMTLFQGRVGPDLVSDVACNVLKSRFIAYTQEVCRRHGITRLRRIPVKHSSWSAEMRRWESAVYELPLNPWTGSALLLVPQRFLRQLPSIEGEGFWEYAHGYPDEIRGHFQYDIARRVDTRTIARLARRNPEMVRRYVHQFRARRAIGYDVERDPMGRTEWYEAGRRLARKPRDIDGPARPREFCDFVGNLCQEFVWAVEQRGDWRLLWNPNGRPRPEWAVQHLFHIAMLGYCRSHNIDLSPESSSGRGPVDFKFSQGWERRALVEVKLANNSHYWQGVRRQTLLYMGAEDVRCGYFLTVQYTRNDLTPNRIRRVREKLADLSEEFGYTIKPVFVDARPKPSASKA